MTFAVASSRWYEEAGSHRARPLEVERYLAWLQPKVGKRTLIRDIDANMVAKLITMRKAENARAATINRTVLEPLRAILFRARDTWSQKVQSIVWKTVMQKEPKERVRELSAAEEAKLLAAIRPDYRPALEFAILSALRLDELVRMQWEHVDFGGRKLNLRGKGGVIASIPLSVPMERLLRACQPAEMTGPVWLYDVKRRVTGEVAVLGKRPITYQGLKTEWRRARARAGLPSSRTDPLLGYRWHDNRHTGITRLVRDSGNLKLGQKLARHSSIATTMKYAHATEDDLRLAMDSAHSSRESPRREIAKVEKISKIKRKR
jgi:integrase